MCVWVWVCVWTASAYWDYTNNMPTARNVNNIKIPRAVPRVTCYASTTHIHTHAHARSLSLSLSLRHTHTHTHTHTLSLSLSLTHTQTLILIIIIITARDVTVLHSFDFWHVTSNEYVHNFTYNSKSLPLYMRGFVLWWRSESVSIYEICSRR